MKRISPVVIIGSALTIFCLALFIVRPEFITALSSYTYDACLKQVHSLPRSGKVVIVDLDENSLSEYGQWPWSRYRVARLTDKIIDDGASVLVFDVAFPEKDRTSPRLIESDINKFFDLSVKITGIPEDLADFDSLFAQSLKKGRTILSCGMHPSDTIVKDAKISSDPGYESHIFAQGKGANVNRFLVQAGDITVAHPLLRAASSTAFFNAKVDSDGIVRRNPLVWAMGSERMYPALSLEAVRMYKGISKVRLGYDAHGITMVGLGDLVVPIDKNGCLIVNYRTVEENNATGFMSSFPTYSSGDVLSGRVTPGVFKDKIVFVGASAIGLKDVKASPLTEYFSGVEVHATMVDNMLSGDMLWVPNWMPGVHFIVIIMMGTFLSIFISHGRSWLSFLVSVMVILLSIKFSLYLMARHQLVFLPVWVVLSVVIIYPVLTMIKYWQEELQKKKVRNMFGTMVSNDVLRYLEHNPGSFSLTGERAEATMSFSDVAGFTTISESLEPGRLSELLNRYLTPMTDIIMDRNGYLDKYEGDLIMAEWGVPFATEDHAVQACLAALEQQDSLAALRPVLLKEFGHELHVRTGINTGVVTAGNMGSDKKFQYTVMGDAVNQAARFEPANKDYGTMIIIGETTWKESQSAVETRLLDRVIVKGKTKPINIYELICKKDDISQEMKDLVALYEKGLRLHWDRKWNEALDCFDKALLLVGDDGPSAMMRERVVMYGTNPPGDDWGTEYVRVTKD
ncbi:MAG: adenylate/guanylate cyclase domain-containing protein [Kiritimatiellae bacterium]|nr:adenylate/guanylate cyclase domain-containing protein [Kiritimatiellia bacterium]